MTHYNFLSRSSTKGRGCKLVAVVSEHIILASRGKSRMVMLPEAQPHERGRYLPPRTFKCLNYWRNFLFACRFNLELVLSSWHHCTLNCTTAIRLMSRWFVLFLQRLIHSLTILSMSNGLAKCNELCMIFINNFCNFSFHYYIEIWAFDLFYIN